MKRGAAQLLSEQQLRPGRQVTVTGADASSAGVYVALKPREQIPAPVRGHGWKAGEQPSTVTVNSCGNMIYAPLLDIEDGQHTLLPTGTQRGTGPVFVSLPTNMPVI